METASEIQGQVGRKVGRLMRQHRFGICCIATFALVILSRPSRASTGIVAVSGGQIPGTSSVFSPQFGDPLLNNRGQVGFTNYHLVNRVTYLTSRVFLAQDGKISLIADASTIYPDGGATPSLVIARELNAAGQLVFQWAHTEVSGSPPEYGWFVGTPDSIVPLLRDGELAPDGNGTVLWPNIDSAAAFNDRGQFVYQTHYKNALNVPYDGSAVLVNDGSFVTRVATSGMPGPDGMQIDYVWQTPPSINNVGQFAFFARLEGGTTPVMIRSSGGTMQKLWEYGQGSPRGDGILFGPQNYCFAFNDLGQIAYYTFDAADPEDGLSYRHAVVRTDGDLLYELARKGDPVPGGNGVFYDFGSYASYARPSLNNIGELAFLCHISETANDEAGDNALVVSGHDGHSLTLVARDGEPAPDGNGKFAFGLSTTRSSLTPILNDLGQVAFLTSFTDTVAGSADDSALLLRTGDNTQVIAREGNDLLGSQIKELSGFDLNNHGQVAYRFSLVDGRSGIALWSTPEPTTGCLMCLGAIIYMLRRSDFRRSIEHPVR